MTQKKIFISSQGRKIKYLQLGLINKSFLYYGIQNEINDLVPILPTKLFTFEWSTPYITYDFEVTVSKEKEEQANSLGFTYLFIVCPYVWFVYNLHISHHCFTQPPTIQKQNQICHILFSINLKKSFYHLNLGSITINMQMPHESTKVSFITIFMFYITY